MKIFYHFQNRILIDYRGIFLGVKATLRLASEALTLHKIPLTINSELAFQSEKNLLFVTHVGELSVTHVSDCTKSTGCHL
jgi:hypothetical protein